jgi:hypothetical protein
MNKIFISFLLFISFFSIAHSQKKYTIKSAIITFDNTITIMGMRVKQKQILYFDDYGVKECKELYEDTTLMESVISDGKDVYRIVFEEKTAYKKGGGASGTEPAFGWNEISADDKRSGKAKKLDAMTVAGKTCEAYEHTEGDAKTTIAGWNNIRLFVDVKSKEINSVSKATAIQESVEIPSQKFVIPKGYTLEK